MTDGESPDYFEVTTPCQIDGCWTLLVGDVRCTEHGGHPTHESHSDSWGNTGWEISKEEQEGVTDARQDL